MITEVDKVAIVTGKSSRVCVMICLILQLIDSLLCGSSTFRIAEHLLSQSTSSADLIELIKGNPQALQMLRVAAEKAKCELSSEHMATVDVAMPHLDGRFEATLNRAELETIMKHFVDRTLTMLDKVISDAKIVDAKIKHVLMVGGSSRLLPVRAMLEARFPNALVCCDLNPDTVVGAGAGELGAQMLFEEANALLDVAPLGLGIAVGGHGEIMSVSNKHNTPEDSVSIITCTRHDATLHSLMTYFFRTFISQTIIPRNSRLPATITKNYTTRINFQQLILVNVYEGERYMVRDNDMLTSLNVAVPSRPAGQSSIAVTFNLDVNGTLAKISEVANNIINIS